MATACHEQPATANQTIDAIVDEAGRDHAPLRKAFLQKPDSESGYRGSAMADLVRAGDSLGLRLYLTAVLKASSPPWDTALPAPVWARALGNPQPTSKGATGAISKAWRRLEDHGLIRRSRYNRMAQITLLREDGSGQDYTHPGDKDCRTEADDYFKVPVALWRLGSGGEGRWIRELSVPELAMLLVSSSLRDEFWLPIEHAPDWYGVSADTAQRGLAGLRTRDLLDVDVRVKTAPLSPTGATTEHLYTLKAPFGLTGRRQRSRRRGAKR
ncbi:hypothetical protein [Candidatus Poriferisodalis multihospitum]|uniref:hypothetical protein n=1 Tax=Candidatus Poriferisodalis multihospitum TaxID=2983191 RepID=UPI002B26027F|nr:hypothetical protein [Candidatus Poriferisodalis multihospitum]